LARYVAP